MEELSLFDYYDFAKVLASLVHQGQVDKGGKPYIEHPVRVADLLSDYESKTVAYLHDVVEDTWITEEILRKLFPKTICDAVMLLTRKDGETYDAFIDRIIKSDNKIAISVKIADITDNLNLGRLEVVTDKDIERAKKYANAMLRLKKALEVEL